jgi:hypothetical protein
MSYQSASASQGSCSGGQQLSCNLGTLAVNASATITVTVRATQAGTFTNTATVRGDQPEPNLANNTASAQTTVTSQLTPPAPARPAPKPAPKPAVCYAFTVTPKGLFVGRQGTIVVRVTLRGKAIRGARVVVRGAGVDRSARTNARGFVRITISPRRAGILRITVPNRASCTAKRIGVTGAFEPPVTG